MCGFAGGIASNARDEELDRNIQAMLEVIESRGPDDQGVWVENNVGLGHRRLSILDLSPNGHQPMVSHCGRYVIAYNGEVYNFEALKTELQQNAGVSFSGHSDTEVVLTAISVWGIEKTLPRLNGMFAFAVWDRKTKDLTLARDKFGEKPLYYYLENGIFYYGSEVKCFEAVADLKLDLDDLAVSLMLQCGYIPAPHSIYKQVRKVMPGQSVRMAGNGNLEHFTYWSAYEAACTAKANPYASKEDAVDDLERILKSAVAKRMVSDVPLGAFLSGGIDSSTVVALMQAQSSQPINTFSIGFAVEGYNEAGFAAQVATHLGTSHNEFYLNAADALAVVPDLGAMYDEPFADSSQIPTYLLSRMTREKVTVALSGDGGDELFCGYNRYHAAIAMWSKFGRIPGRRSISFLLRHAPVKVLESMFFFLRGYANRYSREGALGPKVRRFADWLVAQSVDDLYRLSIRHWSPAQILATKPAPIMLVVDDADMWTGLDALERMMLLDTTDYLPGDILTKVDRASMAVSLEARLPLLDPEVFEAAWRMPVEMKTFNNEGKWPLKQVLARYVPTNYFARPKRGFAMPVGDWLKEDLKDWATELLEPGRLKTQGIVNADIVTKTYDEHLKGHANHSEKLWDVLMLQAWLGARKH